MIEFRCSQCGATLRVPAGTEGKQAKCPQCSAVMTIPTPPNRPAEPFRPAPPPGPADFSAPPPREGAFHQTGSTAGPTDDSNNPFQAPQFAGASFQNYSSGERGFHPSPIYFGEVFDRSWQIFKANLGLLLGGGALIFVAMGIISQLLNVLFGVKSDQFQVGFEIRADDPSNALRQFAAGLVGQAVNAFFFIGWITMTLKIARGEEASLGDLFGAAPRYPTGAVIHLLFSLFATIGFMLCFVPGIWFVLTFGLTMYMYVDQHTNIADSFRYSYQAMRGNKLTLLGLYLAMLGLIAAGTIACCVGLFVALPFCGLLVTVAYLAATGQLPRPIDEPAPYTTP